MFTGEPIGAHGVIDYIQLDASQYHISTGNIASSGDYAERTTFAALSRQGRKIACIALPMTWPAFSVNGIMISGFPLPDEMRPTTWPQELAASLPPFSLKPLTSLRYEAREDIQAWLHFHVDRIEEYTLDCWKSRRYDAVFSCFAAPDIAHHFFWTPDQAETREAMFPIYERVDRALERLLRAVEPDDLVIVHSDHGGGPAPSRVFGVNRWLMEQGWLALRSARREPLVQWTNRAVQWAKRRRLNQWLAPVIRGRLRGRVSDLTHNAAFMNWRRSVAYGMSFFYPLVGIEVNRSGRQSEGVVPPGPETDALLDDAAARLRALVDPATGVAICGQLWRKEESLPDRTWNGSPTW